MLNSDPARDDFYCHYAPIPRSFRRFLLVIIPVLVLGFVAIATVIPGLHDGQANAGKIQGAETLEGLLVANPVPNLIVPRPGNTDGDAAFSRYVLSATNKAGVSPNILELAGSWVSLTGIVVARNDYSMVAVRSAEAIAAPEGVTIDSNAATSLGEYDLTGEILDGKCYPGIMKPGRTKTHRACAIRCIAGGVPAVFRVENSQGETLYFLLENLEGKAVNDRVLPLVADRVRIRGEVLQYDDMLVVKADPDSYERV